MAKNLQEKSNCDLFSITDLSGKPQKFFQEQSILKYLKKWFYYDHILPNKKSDFSNFNANSLIERRGIPKFVDIDEKTLCIDILKKL